MAIRLRLPGLLDVLVVWRPLEVAELDAKATVDRPVLAARGLLNRAVARRIDPGLRFGNSLLRVFRCRDDRSRRGPGGESAPVVTLPPRNDDDGAARLREIARWVAGYGSTRPIACLAQELIGRRFLPTYRSTPDLARDARRMGRWFGPLALLGFARARLESSRRRLHAAAAGDLDLLHATSFGLNGFVEALERMRRLVRDDRLRTRLGVDEAVARCLRPPKRALRSTTAPTLTSFRRAPLPRGTMILMLTRRAHRIDPIVVDPLATGRWNACGGQALVCELLGEVWNARRTEVPVIASRVWPYERLAHFVGQRLLGCFTWHRLPGLLGVIRLVGFRTRLRREVLLDTESPPIGPAEAPTRAQRAGRSADGRFNDLDLPEMGAAGTRFGRNVRPSPPTAANLLDPNPRMLSAALMTRHDFKPAPSLNLLAAAWIQFMVHGWFNHARSEHETIDLPPSGHAGDPRPDLTMKVPRSIESEAKQGEPAELAPFYDNTETHWWDASQLYGSDPGHADSLREKAGGRLLLRDGGLLPIDAKTGLERSGFTDNWWLGLGIMHTLFAREHNAVCDHLAGCYPDWSDDELYRKARLVVSALLAKIHTLEWTPAILDQPALHMTGRTTWYGVLRGLGERAFDRRWRSDLWAGVPGSESTHHGVRYALTEEFVSVYRMHQLLPDEIELHDVDRGGDVEKATLGDVLGRGAVERLERIGLEGALHSFGVANAGAIALDNFPRALQHLVREGEEDVDLAAVDILRDRERGVPRYNLFRERMLLKPVPSFEALCDDPGDAARLSTVYGGDISKLDLQIGMAAERKPAGFGFGETAFRVFTLMAVRRLKSDRFFTTDYDAATYSPEGLEWVANNDLASVIQRHAPGAAFAPRGAANFFAPWPARH